MERTPKEYPILFSSPMVRAILDGRKTMTRRVIVPQPTLPAEHAEFMLWGNELACADARDKEAGVVDEWRCPYGQTGDRLWVRETWQQVRPIGRGQWKTVEQPSNAFPDWQLLYAADTDRDEPPKWRPSIFMPRWACRLELENCGVGVAQVNRISAADCVLEGLLPTMRNETPILTRFQVTWNEINEARGYGWESNPWVWVISFKRINQEKT